MAVVVGLGSVHESLEQLLDHLDPLQRHGTLEGRGLARLAQHLQAKALVRATHGKRSQGFVSDPRRDSLHVCTSRRAAMVLDDPPAVLLLEGRDVGLVLEHPTRAFAIPQRLQLGPQDPPVPCVGHNAKVPHIIVKDATWTNTCTPRAKQASKLRCLRPDGACLKSKYLIA